MLQGTGEVWEGGGCGVSGSKKQRQAKECYFKQNIFYTSIVFLTNILSSVNVYYNARLPFFLCSHIAQP